MKKCIPHGIFGLLFTLSVCISFQGFAQTNLVPDDQEFQALKALYDSLGGPNWTNKTNWPTPGNWPATATAAQMGTWFGVTVQSGDIFKVILSANNLTGKVPAAISLMSQVTQIQLNSNHLTGSLPSSLGSLSKLLWLRFDTNQLTGTVPASLGNLPLLQHLYFDGNSLTGTIPPALGNLSSLLVLSLSNNQLTGSIPSSLGGLSNLTNLYLHNNQLSGTIPESLGNLTQLTTLYLRHNQLTGTLPASLGNLTKLKGLFLNENSLTGSIPASLGGLADLEFLNLQQNQLTGSVPSELGNLSKLVQFYIAYNRLSGVIPEIFGGMTTLSSVNFSTNYFSGPFPTSIGSCVALTALYGDTNKFTSVPVGVLTLPVLNYINFEGNEINSIPDFSNHVNKTALRVFIKNNGLDFSQLEPLINTGILQVVYTPQKTINDVSSVALNEGSQLVLTARPTGQFSTVIWEKQNTNGTWATLTNDQDSNPQTYTRTAASLTDAGVYRWRMTNTKVTGVNLQSDPIPVKTPTHFVLDDLAFQYKYDARKRMTHKKVPGADWVYMVYDDRDRLVMTQDGEQRKTYKWSFTKYDALNRPVMTGIYTHSGFIDQVGMSGQISTANFFETYNGDATNHGYSKGVFPFTGTEILTVTYYDNYDFVTNAAYQFDDDALEGQYRYAAGSAFPRVTGQVTGTKVRMLSGNGWAKTVNYYDDNYRVVQVVASNHQGGIDRTTNRYDFVGKVRETNTVHTVSGLQWKNAVNIEVTGNTLIKTGAGSWGNAGAVSSQTLAAGTDGWMEAIVPENGTWSEHIGLSSGDPNFSFTNIEYGFRILGFYYAYVYENGVQPAQSPASISVVPGDVLRVSRTGSTITYYKNGALLYTSAVPSTAQLMIDCALKETGSGLQDIRASFIPSVQSVVHRTFNYDHAGRLLKTWHSLNGGATVLLAQNEYNELGQLVTKNLYNTDPVSTPDASRTFKQQLDYRYNIRGWLTRMNNSDVSITENGPRDYFGMNLFYNEAVPELSGYQAQFNGNISAMKWSTNLGLGANVPALEHDGQKENAYAFSYDALNRLKSAAFHTKPSTGWGASSAYHEDNLMYDLNGNIKSLNRTTTEGTPMDQLTYAYSGNQLLKVSDASDKTKGFVDGPSPDNDYTYDANGNMTLDRNKEITAITYNHLNLPDKVTKSTGEYVKYTYDATGRKLSQGVYNASNVLKKKSDYAGEFFYENDSLKFVNHEEGRVVMTGAAPEYQYHLKDIWNNTRLTFTTKSEVDTGTATMEDASASSEVGMFLYYTEAVRVNTTLFDHTNAGTTYFSTRLNGSSNERTGLARSISVMPGDTVKMEVYAKYLDTNSSNWTTALNNLIASIANATAPTGTFIDGGATGSTGVATVPHLGLLDKSGETGTAPKAYLNYLIFDRDYNLINSGFLRMTEAAREYGQNGVHEKLAGELVITQPGYAYIYLSNDNAALGGPQIEVYFDDFKVTQVKSPTIQTQDYYSFGLTFNDYKRENSLENKIKFQAQERITDLGLNWDAFKYRNYMPDIGRFFNIDPLAESYVYNSPYAFAENKLGLGIELEGLELFFFARPSPLVAPRVIPRVAPEAVTPRLGGAVGRSSGTTRPINWQRISPSNYAKSGSRGGKGQGKEFTETTKKNDWNQKFGEGKDGQCRDCGQIIRRGIKSEKGEPTPPEQAQGDHMSPKNPKDGTVPGNNSGRNLQWLCPTCNGNKSNISPEQYYNFNVMQPDATLYQIDREPTPQELEQNKEKAKQLDEADKKRKEDEEFRKNGGV